MSTWGGKRPGAGRPKRVDRVPFSCTVLPETRQKINKWAFDWLVSVGDVLDRLASRYKERKTTKK